jgi:hypothetical protein
MGGYLKRRRCGGDPIPKHTKRPRLCQKESSALDRTVRRPLSQLKTMILSLKRSLLPQSGPRKASSRSKKCASRKITRRRPPTTSLPSGAATTLRSGAVEFHPIIPPHTAPRSAHNTPPAHIRFLYALEPANIFRLFLTDNLLTCGFGTSTNSIDTPPGCRRQWKSDGYIAQLGDDVYMH